MNTKLTSLVLGLLALASGITKAAPLGTAFTYQGRLEQNGQPANGAVPMAFRLYDQATGGNAVGAPTNQSVSVVNGLFTVDLDFGAAPFNGSARWLEVTANGTPLAPRTRLAPTPNTIYASTAGTVMDGAITSGKVADNSITGAKIATGQVVKSLNGLRDNVTLAAGANVTLTPSGNTLTIASAGGEAVWTFLNANVYYNAGNVGIGTSNPQRRLQVGDANVPNSEGMIRLASRSGVNGNLRIWDIGVPETDGDAASGYHFVIDDTQRAGTDPEFIIRWDTGNVGIGTTTPAYKLDINGDQIVRGGLRVEGDQNVGGAASIKDDLIMESATAEVDLGVFIIRDWAPSGQTANAARFLVRREGTVGIGTSNPMEKLHINGRFLRVEGAGGEAAYIGGDGAGNDVQVGSVNPSVVNVALYNAATGAYMNLFARDVSCRTLTIYGGADLAEPFPMKEEEIEKGSVVVIDEEHPGRLKRSTTAYDTRVAGVISGANGIHPGISLKQEGVLDHGENVALTGRVYAKADASFGAIKPGDLLTTSDMPGHAMKVTDHARAQGAILGKAMSALNEGTGLVLVLVTLQ